MLVFLNKAQGLLKNKSVLFSVLYAPIYKVISSSILKISENLKIWKFVKCTVPIYKLNKMNFQHTQ